MRPLTASLSTALVVTLAACTASTTEAPPEPADAAQVVDLAIEVSHARSAQVLGVLHVQLTNGGDLPLEVSRLQLRDRRFAAVDPTPKSTTVEPGGRTILTPIDYGEVICDETAVGPASMVVVIASGDGSQELSLPVGADGEAVLARLHEASCRERVVAAGATISFGEDWEPTAPAVARGTIVIERVGTEDEVVIEQAEGTVILALTSLDHDGDGEVLVLAEGKRSAEVAVEVSAARCDPHALIESKRTYSFPLWVRVGDLPTTYVVLEPEGDARTAMEALLATGCDLEG